MRRLAFFMMFVLVFIWGFLVDYKHVFPYWEVRYVKKMISPPSVDEGRFVCSGKHHELHLSNIPYDKGKSLVLVSYGQSNTCNYGQYGYKVRGNVFMVNEGKVYRYEEPVLGGDGRSGSVWGRLGDMLIERNPDVKQVYIVMAGYGGRSLKELTFGEYYDYFERQLVLTLQRFGKVDAILFHQGESDAFNCASYYKNFAILEGKIRKHVNAPIYVSQTSYCGLNSSDAGLLGIQEKIVRNMKNVYRGPNTDVLDDPKYRLPDRCHFSAAGLDAFAEMWYAALAHPSEI